MRSGDGDTFASGALALPTFERVAQPECGVRVLKQTSGLSVLTAVETTTASAPCVFSAACPIMILMPLTL